MIINQTNIAKYGVFPKNYDLTEVMAYVDTTEQIWILPLIGDAWYEELNEQVENNTLSDENATALVECLWPLLSFALAYEALPMIWSNISEVGVVTGHSENSDSLSLKDLNYVQQHLRRMVEVKKDFAIKWLCTHQDSFPLFDSSICDCGCGCKNSCGLPNGKLNMPNPNFQLFAPIPKCTDIK